MLEYLYITQQITSININTNSPRLKLRLSCAKPIRFVVPAFLLTSILSMRRDLGYGICTVFLSKNEGELLSCITLVYNYSFLFTLLEVDIHVEDGQFDVLSSFLLFLWLVSKETLREEGLSTIDCFFIFLRIAIEFIKNLCFCDLTHTKILTEQIWYLSNLLTHLSLLCLLNHLLIVISFILFITYPLLLPPCFPSCFIRPFRNDSFSINLHFLLWWLWKTFLYFADSWLAQFLLVAKNMIQFDSLYILIVFDLPKYFLSLVTGQFNWFFRHEKNWVLLFVIFYINFVIVIGQPRIFERVKLFLNNFDFFPW